MKRIAKKREPQPPHPVDEIVQTAAAGARIAVTLGLMALDGLVRRIGYELRRKAKPKPKKAKAKPGAA